MNNKIVGLIVIILVLVLAGAVYVLNNKSDSNSTATSSPSAANSNDSLTQEVSIENSTFSPATVTIKRGTTVTWTNKDDVQHNVVAEDKLNGPSGPLLAKGESYSYTFTTVGTYEYSCEPHPFMKGTILVTE